MKLKNMLSKGDKKLKMACCIIHLILKEDKSYLQNRKHIKAQKAVPINYT